MHNDNKFVVDVNIKSLNNQWKKIITNFNVKIVNNLPNASTELKQTMAWRYWTQQALAELAKYKRGSSSDNKLQVHITKKFDHNGMHGMWFTYTLKDVPSNPFIDRVQWYWSGMNRVVEVCFPSFLRRHFIEAYGRKLGFTTNMLSLDRVEDDEYDEYYTPALKSRFTPQGWNSYNAPRKYDNLEECEKLITNNKPADMEPGFKNWHDNVRRYGYDANEVKHLWGDVYELKMFYTWGSSGGKGSTGGSNQGGSKVTSTSKVNARTGKIISVRVTTDDGFDGDIDENNQLKVLNDKFTPDGFVYGFKVAKTMKGEPCIVKLMIPRRAKVACHVNDTKLRVDQAWVVGVFKYDYDENTQTVTYGDMISVARSFYYKEHVANGSAPEFLYRVGDLLKVPDFDPNLGSVCVPGIHFFFSQKQLFHLIKRDVTHWSTIPEFIKGYKRVLGLRFQSRSSILKDALNK